MATIVAAHGRRAFHTARGENASVTPSSHARLSTISSNRKSPRPHKSSPTPCASVTRRTHRSVAPSSQWRDGPGRTVRCSMEQLCMPSRFQDRIRGRNLLFNCKGKRSLIIKTKRRSYCMQSAAAEATKGPKKRRPPRWVVSLGCEGRSMQMLPYQLTAPARVPEFR